MIEHTYAKKNFRQCLNSKFSILFGFLSIVFIDSGRTMIVKFIARNNQYNDWLIKDKLYIVLDIYFNFYNKKIEIVVKSEDNHTPYVFDLSDFEIINSDLPQNWNFILHDNESVSLRPKEFLNEFWEEFHDGNPEYEKIFWDVYRKLEEFYIAQALFL